jgi:putative transposase
MKLNKSFKYRLYPTKNQQELLLQLGGNTRFLWNLFLQQNIDEYNKTEKFKFRFDLQASLPKLKEAYPFLKLSHSQSLQIVAKQFDMALRDLIKYKKGFPKFKKKNLLTDSFTSSQTWSLNKTNIRIPKIGYVKWKKHRNMQGKPKNITISQDGEKWYCSVLCESDIKEKELKNDNIVGIDLGLKEFVTLSDETVIQNIKVTKKYENKLAREQRRLSRKKKGSNNRFKQRLKVRNVHEKIRNIRKDFLHKTTSHIIAKYDGVVLEDLNIKKMLKNKYLAKSISDVSWHEFKRQLEYKSLWNSKYCIIIDRFAPTSKTCSKCGNIQDMPLSKRTYNCSVCNLSMNRDLNAAINIHKLGINTLGQREIKACGDESIDLSVKQEQLFN